MLQVLRRRQGDIIRINDKRPFMLIRMGAIEVQMGVEAPSGYGLNTDEYDRLYQRLPVKPPPTRYIVFRR
jgi:sRNA-binding carbon storage regulator CsrA